MKKTLISLLIVLLPFNVAFASITQTTTLEPVQQATHKADQKTLVIFDVDEVLITPKDQIFKPAHKTTFYHLKNDLMRRLPPNKVDELWGVILKTRKSILVDPNVISVLAKLKEQNIKTIALTKSYTGKMGQIEKMENWRIHDLANRGINFSYSFPELGTIKFAESASGQNSIPMHKKGIVFTCNKDKGKILRSFLQTANFKPTSIIFVDDKRDNLESVEKLCQQLGIQFTGFHYTACRAQPDPGLDHKRARLQLATLAKQGKWLSDREADQLRR